MLTKVETCSPPSSMRFRSACMCAFCFWICIWVFRSFLDIFLSIHSLIPTYIQMWYQYHRINEYFSHKFHYVATVTTYRFLSQQKHHGLQWSIISNWVNFFSSAVETNWINELISVECIQCIHIWPFGHWQIVAVAANEKSQKYHWIC